MPILDVNVFVRTLCILLPLRISLFCLSLVFLASLPGNLFDELTNQLTEKDQLLENEKQLNKQLRAQVAALSSDAAHGTSV